MLVRGLTFAHVCPSLLPRYLPIASGTSLRAFLSEALNCDPMRVSKKYFGDARLSRQSFVPAGSRAHLPLASLEDLAAAVDASQVSDLTGKNAQRGGCSGNALPPSARDRRS